MNEEKKNLVVDRIILIEYNDTQIYLGFLFNIYNKIINKDER